MKAIDLNCDLGESFGAYTIGNDEQVLKYISSANVACGFHAGDPDVMKETVKLAIQNGVRIGAHPGLQDLSGFGRREMKILPAEAYNLVAYQIGALQAIAATEGAAVHHVKPHGALYNMASKDERLAEAIAKAVYDVSPKLVLFALAGSKLYHAGVNAGLTVAQEVFADRTYQPDGTLTPRTEDNALIHDEAEAISRVVRMAKEGKVEDVNGNDIEITPHTVCVHGDGPKALAFVEGLKAALTDADIAIQPVGAKDE
ncbi:5-oxoprolinase subunit PxpA [Bacillus tianshenii]|nr:5-oxoprolinase subunit PxpA [Bacillus tianshenii]